MNCLSCFLCPNSMRHIETGGAPSMPAPPPITASLYWFPGACANRHRCPAARHRDRAARLGGPVAFSIRITGAPPKARGLSPQIGSVSFKRLTVSRGFERRRPPPCFRRMVLGPILQRWCRRPSDNERPARSKVPGSCSSSGFPVATGGQAACCPPLPPPPCDVLGAAAVSGGEETEEGQDGCVHHRRRGCEECESV